MRPGNPISVPKRGRRLAAAVVSAAALAAPAAASADATVVEAGGTQLRITGLPGVPSKVAVSYRAAENRFVLTDQGGIQAINPDCIGVDPATVSCDASRVLAIEAALGDGDDVLVIDAGKGEGVPRRYATELRGESGADVIVGGLGNDRIFGQKGRDSIGGWSGNDFLSGGPGADAVTGFGGNDTLLGGSGRDALFGQKGHDRMFGGPQNDVLLARDGTRDPKLVCGGGSRQVALTDRHDPRPSNCRAPKKGK